MKYNFYSIKRTAILLLFIITVLFSCSDEPSNNVTSSLEKNDRNIVLMHPTVNNIRIFHELISQSIFPLPEDINIVGVYHQKSAYDYTLSEEYLKINDLPRFSLYGISSSIDAGDLYRENSFTPDIIKLFENSEGMFFMGGPDIPPSMYNEKTSLLTVVTNPYRHFLEASVLFHLLGGYQNENYIPLLEKNKNYMILGICLGMQTMNVATGGTLIQDIPSEVYGLQTVEEVIGLPDHMQHRNYHRYFAMDDDLSYGYLHPVKVQKGHMLAIAGDSVLQPVVESSHHQAADRIGKGFEVTATSVDGRIAEALEHTVYPGVLGVQFHPERTYLYDQDQKLRFTPQDDEGINFSETYSGEKGENFHRRFWKNISNLLTDKQNKEN